MIRTVVLPNAVDGIVTGCILAIGRITGESAALLFTAGFGLKLNGFIKSLRTSSATLTVALYVYASEQGKIDVAFAIALILMVLTLIINFAAGFAGKHLKRELSFIAPFVGRGLDPADPVLIFEWYVEWYYFRNDHRKCPKIDS